MNPEKKFLVYISYVKTAFCIWSSTTRALTYDYVKARATDDSRYTFSAKEKPACRNASSGRDDETQYSYFGARYYDSDLSVWLSVDPLSDKYPSMSPYMYCAGNPVVFVDPDGNKVSYAGSGQRSKIGTFLRVQWDALVDKEFRDVHKSRRQNDHIDYVYMDVQSANYTRPKNASVSNAHATTGRKSIDRMEVKINTKEKNWETTSDNKDASEEYSENRLIRFPSQMQEAPLKIKIKFDNHSVPDKIDVYKSVLSSMGSDPELIYSTTVKVYKGRIIIKTNSKEINNQINLQISNPDTKNTDFEYKVIVKPKLERSFE